MDRTARQKIIKEIEDLNNTINLIRHSRTFCSIAAEYAFFSSAQEHFLDTSGHRTNLSIF